MEQTLEKYLEQIEKYLRPMAVSERIDVIREIKSEMQELQSSGLSAQEILERLGAPKALARAYLGESINYWWGLSSGMIDLICSASVPARTRQLVELVRKQIETGEFSVFSGEIYDQAHRLRTREGESLNPEQIIRMDWLADNVEGRIPRAEDLVAEAAPMVQIQGIFSEKDGM